LTFDPDDFPESPPARSRPRLVRLPSRPAQVALLLAGAVALALLVLQVLADGRHGFISGQGISFANATGARLRQPATRDRSGQR
jgi:hypothetical protein